MVSVILLRPSGLIKIEYFCTVCLVNTLNESVRRCLHGWITSGFTACFFAHSDNFREIKSGPLSMQKYGRIVTICREPVEYLYHLRNKAHE